MARTKKVDTETTVQETVSEEITEVSAVENSNEAAESQDKPEQCVPINKLSETLKKKAVTGSRVAYCYQQSAKLAQQLKK